MLDFNNYLRTPLNPNIPPHIPPMMCAVSDIWLADAVCNISFPTKRMATNIKVTGICPALTLVKDTNKINIKTMPLAPISPVLKKSTLRIPVTNAVTIIIYSSFCEPYFSSMMGPNNNMKVRFPNKWSRLPCPIVCVIRVIMDNGFDHCMSGPTEKSALRLPAKKTFRKYTTVQISANVSITGELNFILNGILEGFILEFFYHRQGHLRHQDQVQCKIWQSIHHLQPPAINAL